MWVFPPFKYWSEAQVWNSQTLVGGSKLLVKERKTNQIETNKPVERKTETEHNKTEQSFPANGSILAAMLWSENLEKQFLKETLRLEPGGR